MSRIVFLLEERAMQVLLDGLLPRLFPGPMRSISRRCKPLPTSQISGARCAKATRRGNRTFDSRVPESVGRTAHGAAFDPRAKSLQQFSCAYGGYRGDGASARQCIARKADLMAISNHDRVGKALALLKAGLRLSAWPKSRPGRANKARCSVRRRIDRCDRLT